MRANTTSLSFRQRPPNFVFEIVRTRLMNWLGGDLPERNKLVSIVAPIGYGKTVLMTAFYNELRHRGHSCVWLGLNERHKTIDHLLSCFDLAADTAGHALQTLVQGDTSLERKIENLLEIFAEQQRPVTIFIDNLNSCTDHRLGAVLDALIFRTASPIYFIWSSTTDPDFNFGRARLEGLVRQIGLAELSLNEAEVEAMFGDELSVAVGRENLKAIVHHTEGWPAATRMMQIVLSEAEEPKGVLDSFSGADEDIVSLLKRQVMGRFSATLQQFLLRLALLRNFSLELCRFAIGDHYAREHLEFLVQRNVFMIPLDRNRERYRLHNMFREYLVAEAYRLLDEDSRCEVLRRASEWCERREDWHDAMEYAQAAMDLERCSRIFDELARAYVREQFNVQQYVLWVQQFEALGGELSFVAHFWYVWALVFQRGYQLGRKELESLEKRFSAAASSDANETLMRRVLLLRMCLDLFTDRLMDAEVSTRRWLKTDNGDDAYATSSVYCVQSVVLSGSLKSAQARQAMLVAQPLLLEVGGPYTIGWISLINGTIAAIEGEVATGYRDLMPALSRARNNLGAVAPLSCAIASVAAFCAVEMGEFADARQLLDRVIPNLQSNLVVDHVAFGLEAAIKLWSGDHGEPQMIGELRAVTRSYPPRLALMFSCFLIQRLLTLGEIKAAMGEAQLVGLDNDLGTLKLGGLEKGDHPRFRELWCDTQLQLLVATRQLQTAATLVAEEISEAKKCNRYARLLELELVSANISLRLGRLDIAAKSLISAVRRAAKRRILRPFFDCKTVLGEVVQQGGISVRSFALKDESQFFEELCERINIEWVEPRTMSANVAAVATEVVAPTQREAELLSLLDTGLSNAEIASYTSLSVTTVKWHLKNLYKKLDVNNRAAAMARARDLGLLSK